MPISIAFANTIDGHIYNNNSTSPYQYTPKIRAGTFTIPIQRADTLTISITLPIKMVGTLKIAIAFTNAKGGHVYNTNIYQYQGRGGD